MHVYSYSFTFYAQKTSNFLGIDNNVADTRFMYVKERKTFYRILKSTIVPCLMIIKNGNEPNYALLRSSDYDTAFHGDTIAEVIEKVHIHHHASLIQKWWRRQIYVLQANRVDTIVKSLLASQELDILNCEYFEFYVRTEEYAPSDYPYVQLRDTNSDVTELVSITEY